MPIEINVGKCRDVTITVNGQILGEPDCVVVQGRSVTLAGVPVKLPGNPLTYRVTIEGLKPGTSRWVFRNAFGVVLAEDTVTVTIDPAQASGGTFSYGDERAADGLSPGQSIDNADGRLLN